MNNFIESMSKYIECIGLNEIVLKKLIDLYLDNYSLDPNRKVTGVDIYRNYEYLISLEYLNPCSSDTILDIGSRDTFWASMLFKRYGSKVYSTDISDEFFNTQMYFLKNMNKVKSLNKEFFIQREDTTKLTFEANRFEKVSAISVIEHIPGDGDIQAVKEFERVVKKEGTIVIAAPFGPEFNERNSEYYGGYEKRYDYNSLYNRIINSTNLKLDKLSFINGNSKATDMISDFWYSNRLYNYLGYASMFFTYGMFNISEEPTEASRGFVAKFLK